jgi:hypothetical protein
MYVNCIRQPITITQNKTDTFIILVWDVYILNNLNGNLNVCLLKFVIVS